MGGRDRRRAVEEQYERRGHEGLRREENACPSSRSTVPAADTSLPQKLTSAGDAPGKPGLDAEATKACADNFSFSCAARAFVASPVDAGGGGLEATLWPPASAVRKCSQ